MERVAGAIADLLLHASRLLFLTAQAAPQYESEFRSSPDISDQIAFSSL